MPEQRLSVDLGGTQMRAAVVTPDGGLVERRVRPTPRQDTCPDALLALVGDIVGRIEVEAAVIGLPGRVSHIDGTLEFAPNLPPHWREALREDLLSEHLGVPVAIGNDADLAAVGEVAFGAAIGFQDVVYVTISTGIGAGVVLGGRLLHGRRSLAEAGHTVIDLSAIRAGNVGKAEDRGSGTALGRAGEARGLPADGAELTDLVRQGDPTATEVHEQVVTATAAVVTNLVHLFSPQVVVLGGGMGRDPLTVGPVRRWLAEHGPKDETDPTLVRTATLGDDAGLLGAARWQAMTGRS